MSNSGYTSLPLSLRNFLFFAVWAFALYGTLQLHRWTNLFGHALCGPWGCGPPVSALVGYHGFWCLLILPAAAILKGRLHTVAAKNVGLALVLTSAAGIAALLLRDGLNNSAAEKYLLQWCMFRIATFVEFPLVQLGLAGLWIRRRSTPVQTKNCVLESNDVRRERTQKVDL